MAYRKFKPELKRRVVEERTSGSKRIAEICRKYQLSDSLVRRWRKQYEKRGARTWGPPEEGNGELAAARPCRWSCCWRTPACCGSTGSWSSSTGALAGRSMA